MARRKGCRPATNGTYTRGRSMAQRAREPRRVRGVRQRLRVVIKQCSPGSPKFGVDIMRDGTMVVDVRRGIVCAPDLFDGRRVRVVIHAN